MGTRDVKAAARTARSSGARARGAITKILFSKEGEYRDKYGCTGKGGGGGGEQTERCATQELKREIERR